MCVVFCVLCCIFLPVFFFFLHWRNTTSTLDGILPVWETPKRFQGSQGVSGWQVRFHWTTPSTNTDCSRRLKNPKPSSEPWECSYVNLDACSICSAKYLRQANPSNPVPHWFYPGWCSICSSCLPPLWDNKRTHASITVSCVTHQSAVREGKLVRDTVCWVSIDLPHAAASAAKSPGSHLHLHTVIITGQASGVLARISHCLVCVYICMHVYVYMCVSVTPSY